MSIPVERHELFHARARVFVLPMKEAWSNFHAAVSRRAFPQESRLFPPSGVHGTQRHENSVHLLNSGGLS
ncbi:hypothetical protein [Oleispirillum naphthae]|uniref:hypothetical protein n=1 Tax=Oleispirillum naphthae TaxID=2838853 RepID=UPI003082641A